ncbi:hypothetical protein BC940DRAFT_309480 [Gongronella butleri]|nr:hypothetical protein BC940DRAFT_309480 [Gongronella butleri]
MNIECIFVVTMRPIPTPCPPAKKVRMMEDVLDMEQTYEAMQATMAVLKEQIEQQQGQLALPQQKDSASMVLPYRHPILQQITSEKNNDNDKDKAWSVTVHPTRQGLQLNATLHSVNDFVQFMAPFLPKHMPANSFAQFIRITSQHLHAEQSLKQVFAPMRGASQGGSAPVSLRSAYTVSSPTSSLLPSSPTSTSSSSTASTSSPRSVPLAAFDAAGNASPDATLHGLSTKAIIYLTDVFLDCIRGMVPLVKSYYRPYLRQHPHSTMALSIAAYLSLSTCSHIDDRIYPTSRQLCGQRLLDTVQQRLRDDLFDMDPSLETVHALFLTTQTTMILLRNHDARLYLHMAWQMVNALQPDYLPDLHPQNDATAPFFDPQGAPSSLPTPPRCTPSPDLSSRRNMASTSSPPADQGHEEEPGTSWRVAKAETWRRLYHGVQYMMVVLRRIQNDRIDMQALLSYTSTVGYPQPLACETGDQRRKVNAYRHFVQLHQVYMSCRVAAYTFFHGHMEKAAVSMIAELEHILLTFWQQLPKHFQLNDHPLHELTPQHIADCRDSHVLHLNQGYYIQWIMVANRFILPSSANDRLSLDTMDGHRAVLIVSRCCNALALIAQGLHQRYPCMLDLHWLLINANALHVLQRVSHPQIKSQALANAQMLSPIIRALIYRTTSNLAPPALLQHHQLNQQQQHQPTSPASATSTTTASSVSSYATAASADTMEIEDSPSPSASSPQAVYYNEVKKTLDDLSLEE